ncbi:Ufd1 [Symbiodinium sp. CCMP2456]|nr:Ufd1 [Symbiodinium sp. CCMP2456]
MQANGSEEPVCLKVPVTILTGFLGAGKTARLNASLREGRSRIAVIENEIGSLGVDGALVANAHAEADGVIELANGCLCCSAEVDLIAALEALIHRHRNQAVDRILIETTGLADVGPVISLLEDAKDPLAEDLYLDGVVTVVDINTLHKWAPRGGPGRHEQSADDIPFPSWSSGFGYSSGIPQVLSLGKAAVLKTFWRQVAFADQIILSKCDLASAAVEEVARLLENVNPLAEVLRPSDSSLQPLPPLRRRPAVGRRPSPAPAAFCGATVPKLRTAGHLDAVDRRTVILPEGAHLLEDSLRRLAKELLLGEAGRTSAPGSEVWRIKGLVQVSGHGVTLLQGVGDQVSLETWADPVKVFFLVFIGVELGQEVLEAAVAACRDRSEPSQALADAERGQPLLYRQPNLAIADWLSIRIGAGPTDCVPMFGGGFFGGGGGEGRGPAGFFGQNARGNFKAEYDVYPVSFMGKEELEKGNKIILPQSALDRLARLNISWPMLFEMTNVATSRSTHGGVQEFSAEEGVCYFPYWMMQNLLLEVGSRVEITNTSLPKGSFVKLQPVHSDFLEIHNPRAVLENSLRNFATLTVGDCIVIDYNQRKYEIEIAECKPTKAISIIEADVNVDFAPPKDYQEPPPPSAAAEIAGASFATKVEEADAAAPEETAAALFGGSGQRVDGKPIRTPLSSPAAGPSPPPMPDEEVLMPWIKRIPGGVKWTSPPYGYGESHMTGAKARTWCTEPDKKPCPRGMKAAGCGAQAGREASNRSADSMCPQNVEQGSGRCKSLHLLSARFEVLWRCVALSCESGWLKRGPTNTHMVPEQQGHSSNYCLAQALAVQPPNHKSIAHCMRSRISRQW